MCGICGFSGIGDKQDLLRMMSSMAYRGPDGQGMWHDGKDVYLGHLRLAIVDIESGQQPLSTVDSSLIVVFNGEIYNHRQLRTDLEKRGHRFETHHSDTEVLLHGYREWGFDLTSRLNGMWAFALVDQTKGILWLSRDRFGKKPIYYSQVGESFTFSSELRSLLAHQIVDSDIDRLSLKKYFAYGYIPAPRSLILNVRKLPAGHNLFFDLNSRTASVRRYWRLDLEPDSSCFSKPAELKERLVEILGRAVQTRMEADVPVGVFLSGGIDSSSIVALAKKYRESVRSFSIGFEEPSFDETQYSSEVARLLGSEHYSETLSVVKCLELLDSVYDRLDEPMGDSSLVPSFLMCKLAKNQVTVALSGDGSDELFAGYDPFKALRLADIYSNRVPKFTHELISNLVQKMPVSHRNMSLDFKLKRFVSGVSYDNAIRNPIWLGPLPPPHLSGLFEESIDTEEIYSEAIEAWDYTKTNNSIDRTLQFYSELYLQNDILVKMDRAGMLNSLEVRSPFLDIEFVDLVRQIPANMKYDGKETKKVLKESLEGYLPSNVIYRSKKGFGIPIGSWFRDGHIDIDVTKLGDHLSTEYVEKLYKQHRASQSDWRSFLWAYYGVQRWIDNPNSSDISI